MPGDRVAFLGTHNWRVHEAVRWWSWAYGQQQRAEAAAAAGSAGQVDVFGVSRPVIESHRPLVWQGVPPGGDLRMAKANGVNAVVCSGQGPNDVQVVKDCRRAGKGVFVESLERFQPSDLAELAAAGGGAPLMTGLYLRFDSVLQEAAELGMHSVVGRPVLYQAHASAADPSLAAHVPNPMFRHHSVTPVAPSLFELGMEQVDALRCLLGAEPTEVYAAGTLAPGDQEGAGLDACQAVALTLKTSTGVVASITLDACGGAASRQRIRVVGDQNVATFSGEAAAADLQAAGVNHFLDAATKGAAPRMSPSDCLRAAAVMAAAAQSLRTGAPVPVCYDWEAAGAAAAAVTTAAAAAAEKLGGAATNVLKGACQLILMGPKAGPSSKGEADVSGEHTPPMRAGSEGGEEGEEVSTPPHQRVLPPPSVPTPESPALLPASHKR